MNNQLTVKFLSMKGILQILKTAKLRSMNSHLLKSMFPWNGNYEVICMLIFRSGEMRSGNKWIRLAACVFLPITMLFTLVKPQLRVFSAVLGSTFRVIGGCVYNWVKSSQQTINTLTYIGYSYAYHLYMCVLYLIMSRSYLIKDLRMFFNALWPSGAIWWHRSWSTLAQVMTCCLTAWSYLLSKYRCFVTNVFDSTHLKAISQE